MKNRLLNTFHLSCSILIMASAPILISCSDKRYEVFDYKIEEWVDKGDVIGAELLILENNKQIIHEAYGWSDSESRKPLEKGAIWTVMSMTKPFTATAILMLMEEGKLSLSDPITKYIPDFKGNQNISIHHLLSQSSGDDGTHGNGGHNVLEFESLEAWIMDWAAQESKGDFGEYAYSNFNYGALAYIIEQVTGKPAEQFIEERIIKPLRLNHTYPVFTPDSNWSERVPSRYDWGGGRVQFTKTWSNRDDQAWQFFTGALGLWMSAEDYAAFLQMWLNGGSYEGVELLSQSTIDEALEIQGSSDESALFGHGYGWIIDLDPLVFRYGGSAGGVGIAFPADNAIVVYLTHSNGGDHKQDFQQELDRVWFSDSQQHHN